MREKVKGNSENFKSALENLQEAAKETENNLEIDGAMKSFELSYELVWRLIKAYLEDQRIVCRTPRERFRQAFSVKLVEYEKNWTDIRRIQQSIGESQL